MHDSRVDLGIEEIPRYADKGYDGAQTRGYDATIKKATRESQVRNQRHSPEQENKQEAITYRKVRFAVMKRAHKAGHVLVTTVSGAGMKFTMSAFVYNLVLLRHLAHKTPT